MLSPYLKHAIDRLFDRLTAVYGREFSGKFDGVTVDAVKAAWGHELRGFERNFDAVAWALDNLPERCPNAMQFKALCRRAPCLDRPDALPGASGMVRGPTVAERETLRRLMAEVKTGGFFPRPSRAWAYRLLDRHYSGEHRATPAALAMAEDAIATDPNRHGRRSADFEDELEAA